MLQDVRAELRAGSRLGCQVLIEEGMEGLRIEVPPGN